MMRFLVAIVVLIAGLMMYIRIAPTRPEMWHQVSAITGASDTQTPGGFRAERRINTAAPAVLQAVLTRALATPRTKLIAGNVDEGMMTFETRSLVMGFPDYTTVAVIGDVLVISGRLRYGRSDVGVNKARIEGWLAALAPLTEPL